MLTRLQVRNYVLIDSLDIEFPEGLIIITGQTGAGKSIILGALSLLLGAKADASMVGESGDNCVVEAEFDLNPDDEQARQILEENEAEWDGGHLIIRRVVAKSGRSRSFVNDSPVSVQVLSQLSSKLVDIHSQHQTLLLSDHQFQLSVLDYFAGNTTLLSDCRKAYAHHQSLKSDLAQLEQKIALLERDRDYNQSQYNQLEAAAIKEGEVEDLEAEQKTLANAEQIKEYLCAAENGFNPQDTSVDFSILNSLKEIERSLERASRFVPQAAELAERVTQARVELDDVAAEVETLNNRLEVSPERLEAVEDRLSLLYALMKKHGCQNEAELIAVRDELSNALFDSTAMEEKREKLIKELKVSEEQLSQISTALHKSRSEAASPFAASMQDSIRSLELPMAIFEVELVPTSQTPSGCDSVIFRFSSVGKNPVDVAKCASGGEMSRIMLSLKDMMARYTNMPTMIFDEIDTGVSGSVADKMGSMICSMGQHMQVFAITHLPQVAAKGCAHYLVSKETEGERTISTIKRLSAEQRVLEVARMLSGSVMTDAAIANAKSLLGE